MLDSVDTSKGLTVTVCRRQTDLIRLEQDWRTLERKVQGAVLFQSYDWCKLALANASIDQRNNIYVIAVSRLGSLEALLPLKIVRKGKRTVLTGLAEPFQEFTEILVLPSTNRSEIYALLEGPLAQSGADYLHFGQVRKTGDLHEIIQGQIPAVGELDKAPFVDVGKWDDYGAYFRSVRSLTRKNIRNMKNKLEREAPVEFTVQSSGPVFDDVLDRSYANRAFWLKEKGLTSRSFLNADFQSFLAQFKKGAGQNIETISFCLTHGGEPIAEQWGLIHQGRYYAYMMGWAPSYSSVSPGKILMQEVVCACFKRGLGKVEFMIPNSPYKQTWAADAIEVQDHVLPFTKLGSLYANIWISTARPLAKRAVMALPASIRRRLRGAIEVAQD